ncbi:MAG: hypothetical protein ABJD97_10765 [Betaproteobacteria bacterium]
MALCTLVLAMPAVRAQTIADYSRVQRAVLESAMTQAAARSAALPASASGAPPAAAPPAPVATLRLPPPAPMLRVSGVFATAASAIAEVAVDDAADLLVAGQAVPGTGWHVESVAVDRVVLSRREPVVGAGASESVRRVFALPVLR